MTVVDYLKNVTGYPIKGAVVEAVLIGRNIGASTDASALTQEQRELLTADILMMLAALFSSSSGSVKKSGDFEIREAGLNMGDRTLLIQKAMKIYGDWGDPLYDESKLGITTWVE